MKYGKAKSKYSPVIDFELVNDDSEFDVPRDEQGKPMIFPPSVWRNKVMNFEQLVRRSTRKYPRIYTTDAIVLYNEKGEIVAKGKLRDLNEKSSGMEIQAVEDINTSAPLFLEILNNKYFFLTQVKVVLRRVQFVGTKLRIGVEFINATTYFNARLNEYLKVKRRENNGFGDNEII